MKVGNIVHHHWAEALAVILLLLGFFVALVIQSPFLHYFTIFLAGGLAARVMYEKHRRQPIFPFIFIIIGFVLGFMLGAISANKFIILVAFFIGYIASYWAHKKGHFSFFKEAGFIK